MKHRSGKSFVYGSVVCSNISRNPSRIASSNRSGESGYDGILMTIESLPVAWYDKPTANKMTYPKELWEILFNNPEYIDNVENKRNYYGEDDHYDEDHVKWCRISQRFTNNRFGDKPNEIISDVSILDTKRGRNVFVCALSGAVGFSTRGLAIMNPDPILGNGYTILDPESYFDICIDAVVNPAVSIAQYVPKDRASLEIYEKTGIDSLSLSRADKSIVNTLIRGKYAGSSIRESLLVGILEDVENNKLELEEAVAVCSVFEGDWIKVMQSENFNINLIKAIENSL